MPFCKVIGYMYPGIFPPEVGMVIEDNFNGTDLLVFRQLNSKIRDNFQEKWLDAFFTNRTHVYSYHGLRALLDITKQPTLVREMKEITLCVLDLDHISAPRNNPGQFSKHQKADGRKMLAAWGRQRRSLRRYDTETRFLQDIFFNLQKLGIIVSVRLADEWRDSGDAGNLLRKALGRDTVRTIGTPLDTAQLVKGPCEGPAKTLLESLILTGYPIQQLDLACPYDNTGLTCKSFDLSRRVLSNRGLAFAHLTHLSIKFDPKLFVELPKDIANVATCFRDLPRLRALDIGVAYDKGFMNLQGYIMPMLDCFPLHQIESLTLHGAYATAGEYITMLDRARLSLESLDMCGCDVTAFDCWSGVFRWAQGKMGVLRCLEVRDIGHVFRGIYEYGEKDSRPVCWDGLVKVSQGLRMLSDRPRYQPHEE
ncbi:hypothetical protein LTR78_000238 [Recurvomyces mirabilis]|uniref:Uncharacterized protein n=1 Tax=Recurvomyces mirabilis TaxID=574656 RepID=A0AAE1C6C9_9PEZI|nr:hypothetical protein LTR78_000238 [Recurvomyces mirabilis]KAK5161894.1 hypothetical protein LTS14_000239 [Recurvomyces mirabilis]